MRKPGLAFVLSAMSRIFLILAFFTILPFRGSQPDLLGYHTLCAFVPVSTLTLLALSGITRMARGSLDERPRSSGPAPTFSNSGQSGSRRLRRQGKRR